VLFRSPQPTPNAAPQETDEPLRFTFPTPGPEPISLWRPPLYDVPWALSPHDHFYFARPILADEVNWPLANYRYGGIFFGSDIVHTGIDIPAPRGTPVHAAGPGKVVWAGYGLYRGTSDPGDPYGLAVTVEHDFGYDGHKLYTVYAHMDRIDVIVGQRVETGTPLGVVGTTGFTTGPHLHFEVRIESNSFFTTRNPELWLSPPQGWGVLVGRLANTNGSILSHQEVVVHSLETGQKWSVISYGEVAVVSDDFYRENLVLSDLPAGRYQVVVDYLEERFSSEVTINPGAVTFFTFRGKRGFDLTALPTPDPSDWLGDAP
jgi:murein DD-endopeptidase MepM/ murein hydrolase activator NlpD